MPHPDIIDLAAVIYSCGKVFDGLQTGRLDTEEFLRTDSTSGISSMHDLALLRDLKAAAGIVITHAGTPQGKIDATLLKQINASMTRSASIEPGALRQDDEKIGVNTVLGRHEPPAVSTARLNQIILEAIANEDPSLCAAKLFLAIAKAQPFKDGNKRTGILAANALLLSEQTSLQLTVPFSENDAAVAQEFNRKLAQAYIHGEDGPVLEALVKQGISPALTRRPAAQPLSATEIAKIEQLKQLIAQRATRALDSGRHSVERRDE